ncbi:MAG: hypothetical protein HY275_02755 [Gemmatimonadetes bacterium]|nr:hypothetical protein [Gemmatimonadota bacterium]
MPAKKPARFDALNVNVPGSTKSVDAVLYHAMRDGLLRLLPRRAPGLTRTEIRRQIGKHVSASQFPGTKADWWSKLVQLDLEARGLVVREDAKPLRWHRA